MMGSSTRKTLDHRLQPRRAASRRTIPTALGRLWPNKPSHWLAGPSPDVRQHPFPSGPSPGLSKCRSSLARSCSCVRSTGHIRNTLDVRQPVGCQWQSATHQRIPAPPFRKANPLQTPTLNLPAFRWHPTQRKVLPDHQAAPLTQCLPGFPVLASRAGRPVATRGPQPGLDSLTVPRPLGGKDPIRPRVP